MLQLLKSAGFSPHMQQKEDKVRRILFLVVLVTLLAGCVPNVATPTDTTGYLTIPIDEGADCQRWYSVVDGSFSNSININAAGIQCPNGTSVLVPAGTWLSQSSVTPAGRTVAQVTVEEICGAADPQGFLNEQIRAWAASATPTPSQP